MSEQRDQQKQQGGQRGQQQGGGGQKPGVVPRGEEDSGAEGVGGGPASSV